MLKNNTTINIHPQWLKIDEKIIKEPFFEWINNPNKHANIFNSIEGSLIKINIHKMDNICKEHTANTITKLCCYYNKKVTKMNINTSKVPYSILVKNTDKTNSSINSKTIKRELILGLLLSSLSIFSFNTGINPKSSLLSETNILHAHILRTITDKVSEKNQEIINAATEIGPIIDAQKNISIRILRQHNEISIHATSI